jgi:cation transport protein ChaC
VKPINAMPRWLTVHAPDGPLQALGFVMSRASPYYAGRLAPEEVARKLSRAYGHRGTGAESIFGTR